VKQWVDRFLDWLCDRMGLCLRFDGDLCAPSGDEDWWSKEDALPDDYVATVAPLSKQQLDAIVAAWQKNVLTHQVVKFNLQRRRR